MAYSANQTPVDARKWEKVFNEGLDAWDPTIYMYTAFDWLVVLGWGALWVLWIWYIIHTLRRGQFDIITYMGFYGMIFVSGAFGYQVYSVFGPIPSILYVVFGRRIFFVYQTILMKYFSPLGLFWQ